MYLLYRWLLSAVALLLAAAIIPGIHVDGLFYALIVALILGFANAILRPIIVLLTLPINILTLGLFTFVINGFLFWFVSIVTEGFVVDNFSSAFLGAIIVSAISWFGSKTLLAEK
ncbi:MAG: phage holin family protein [Patescibacteria group bacterium]|jgi:putative membrane protein